MGVIKAKQLDLYASLPVFTQFTRMTFSICSILDIIMVFEVISVKKAGKMYLTCIEEIGILEYPVWNCKCRKHGKPKNKYSPGGIHVCGLENETCHNSESIWLQSIQDLNDIWCFWLFTCRLEIPAAAMTPNMTINIPPTTGLGMVAKMAPILPKTPMNIMMTPLTRITALLLTCQI